MALLAPARRASRTSLGLADIVWNRDEDIITEYSTTDGREKPKLVSGWLVLVGLFVLSIQTTTTEQEGKIRSSSKESLSFHYDSFCLVSVDSANFCPYEKLPLHKKSCQNLHMICASFSLKLNKNMHWCAWVHSYSRRVGLFAKILFMATLFSIFCIQLT